MNPKKIVKWLKYKKAWENLPPEEAKQLQDVQMSEATASQGAWACL